MWKELSGCVCIECDSCLIGNRGENVENVVVEESKTNPSFFFVQISYSLFVLHSDEKKNFWETYSFS